MRELGAGAAAPERVVCVQPVDACVENAVRALQCALGDGRAALPQRLFAVRDGDDAEDSGSVGEEESHDD